MTEDSNQRLQPPHSPRSSSQSEQIITLKLPADLTQLLQQRSQQSGKSQTEVILAILQSGLCSADANQFSELLQPASEPSREIVEAMQTRLTALEALIPRLVQLEGK